MWAQIITARLKPGKEDQLSSLVEQLQAAEPPESGLLRTTAMRDQNDPNKVYFMIVLESEEVARARESDPQRQAAMQPVRETMAEIFEGDREFLDLIIVSEKTA
jgi:quinol monooxygenase YgiN